ncbi:hypothetical protein HK098_008151, partial [Nowakowskiella sp. JEL0407]
MGRLAGKTIFITGASSGIGEAVAREFAKENANLILTARRIEKIEALADNLRISHGIKVLPVKLDVRDQEEVRNVVSGLPEDFKDINVLVNNAGLVIGTDTVESVSDLAVNTMIDTNIKGVLHVTQAVLPILKRLNSGHIINISSISGREVYPGGGVYCATKHAVDAITRTLRMELVDTPINVTSIDPGMVETEFSVVRYGGDVDKAKNVYKGVEPLTGQDIAE